ncbi:MAG: hypothetical protein U1F87_18845 [Kiritimatiellia bacterium]
MIRRSFLLLAPGRRRLRHDPQGVAAAGGGDTISRLSDLLREGACGGRGLPGGNLQVRLLKKHKEFELHPTGGGAVKITRDHIPGRHFAVAER